MIDMDLARLRYHEQKMNCRNRVDYYGNPIEFRMTFAEWLMVWIESGKWNQRGRKGHEYMMSRYNDIGHYEVGNVKIITNNENKLKPLSPKTLQKMSEASKGRTHMRGMTRTEETKEKARQSVLKYWAAKRESKEKGE